MLLRSTRSSLSSLPVSTFICRRKRHDRRPSRDSHCFNFTALDLRSTLTDGVRPSSGGSVRPSTPTACRGGTCRRGPMASYLACRCSSDGSPPRRCGLADTRTRPRHPAPRKSANGTFCTTQLEPCLRIIIIIIIIVWLVFDWTLPFPRVISMQKAHWWQTLQLRCPQ